MSAKLHVARDFNKLLSLREKKFLVILEFFFTVSSPSNINHIDYRTNHSDLLEL